MNNYRHESFDLVEERLQVSDVLLNVKKASEFFFLHFFMNDRLYLL